jgi:PAS domain S-box-containing protein
VVERSGKMHLVPETSSIPKPLTVQYLDGTADLFKVLATLPIPIVVHDTCENPKIRFVNESFTQAYGYTLADGSSVAEWALKCYPNAPYRAAVMGQWAAEIAARQATGHTVPPNEYRLVDKFGHKRHVRVGFGIHENLVIVTFHDLTATRAAEAALQAERRATEQTAFALTENMPAGAYTMLLRPNASMAEFAFVSKQFLNILDLTQEEAVGDPMTAFSRVHPEDLQRWLQLNSRSFASRQPFSAEARIVAYGQTKWIRAESVPRMLDDGSVIWEGILVDINQLKETQDRLNSVLEASRAFIWTFNLDTQMIEFEKTSAAIHGHEPHLHLDSWMNTLHPGDSGHVVAMLAELKSGIAGRRGATYRRFYPDGSYRWMRIQAGISARDSTGRPVALSGVSFDVTTEMNERLQAQEQQAQLREDL